MAVTSPPLLYEHALNILSGSSKADKYLLRGVAKLSSNVTVPVYAGRVANLNSSGELELGHAGSEVPLFLMKASDAVDVTIGSATSSGKWAQQVAGPDGNITYIPATAGIEIETTEFDTAQTYVRNQFVAALANNTNVNGGRISNAIGTGAGNILVPYTDAICGIVSRPPVATPPIGAMKRLGIWTYYLPAAPA